MSTYDVYFYEAFAEEEELLRRYLPENLKAGFSWKTIQESGHSQPPAKLISLRTQSQLPLQWAGTLQGVLSRSTGYDHLLAYRNKTQAGLPLGYLPLYCNRAVAEQAMLLWMALWRKLSRQIDQLATFMRDGLTGREAQGKTLLVVGVGNIGYQVVRIGRGLEMRVLGVDIVKRHDDLDFVSIEDGLPQADVIVCAMNLTQKNRAYFNYHLLSQARRSALFINISRGELSPVADLLRLLKEKRLAGAALDVYDREGELAVASRQGIAARTPYVQTVRQLAAMENVILTPHNAFNTAEAVQRKAAQSIEQIEYIFNNGRFKWTVPEE